MFVFTYMHGLKLPRWSKWLILAVYLGAVAGVYSWRGFGEI